MTILQVYATMHAEERREIWYSEQFVPSEYQEIRGLRLRGIQRCEDTDHDRVHHSNVDYVRGLTPSSLYVESRIVPGCI